MPILLNQSHGFCLFWSHFTQRRYEGKRGVISRLPAVLNHSPGLQNNLRVEYDFFFGSHGLL
jgi:hypothetical protein